MTDNKTTKVLSIAASGQKMEVIKKTNLLHAIQANDVIKLRSMLDDGVDVDLCMNFCLSLMPAVSICILVGHIELAQVLIESGASLSLPDGSGRTPLHLAITTSPLPFVSYLIKNGANVNAQDNIGQIPLHIACSSFKHGVAVALIKAGSSVNVLDTDRRTPLIYSCMRGDVRTALKLLDVGAISRYQDRCGNSALWYAIAHEIPTVLVDKLVASGAQINAKNCCGDTPLLGFTSYKHTSSISFQASHVLQSLIRNGADINILNCRGQTPLHLVAQFQQPHLVRLLLNHHCNPNALDFLGKSALFYSCIAGCEDTVNLLIAAGINWDQEHWLKEMKHLNINEQLLLLCKGESKRVKKLSELCRGAIRMAIPLNIECATSQLKVPSVLKKLITLEFV